MLYSFQLCPHANTRYNEVLAHLAVKELDCILLSYGIQTDITVTTIAKSTFLCFDSAALTDAQLSQLLMWHSSLLVLWENRDDSFMPLPVRTSYYLPPELPEVLKYKGKTSARFTQLMLSCALSVLAAPGENLTLADPLCGRGTTLFAGACLGLNAIGMDADREAIRQADAHMTRFLELHHVKHARSSLSMTHAGHGVPGTRFVYADTKAHYQAGDTRQLLLLAGDTSLCGKLFREKADLLVTDLPYGVQHAPGEQHGISDFPGFLARVLPSWHDMLKPGGAIALSFNVFTLKKERVLRLLEDSGFVPLTQYPYDNFLHDVEQAVRRDLVIARRS